MIGIIHVGNAYIEPYFEKYKKVLDQTQTDYELILWDRKNEIEQKDGVHVFKKPTSNIKRAQKILNYLRYRKFVKKIVKEKKYDKLIFLTTMSAFTIGSFIKKYKNKYILDIRDLSGEKSKLFQKKLARIIENSSFTSISSDGFREKLPEFDYVRSHNLSGNIALDRQKNTSGKINLLYLGRTRGDWFNKRLIEIFGGDDRFTLNLIGEWIDSKEVAILAKKFENVTVKGKFDSSQKEEFLQKADILINMNIASFNGKRLTANKYYDGLECNLPQIARVDEYTGALVTVKGLGIALDFYDEDFANKVYEYYQNLDFDEFKQKAKIELDRVKEQDREFMQKIEEFLKA